MESSSPTSSQEDQVSTDQKQTQPGPALDSGSSESSPAKGRVKRTRSRVSTKEAASSLEEKQEPVPSDKQEQKPPASVKAEPKSSESKENTSEKTEAEKPQESAEPGNDSSATSQQEGSGRDDHGQKEKYHNSHNKKRRDRKSKRDRFQKKEPEEDIEDLVIKLDEQEHTLVRIAQLQRMNAGDLTKYARTCGIEMVSGQEKSQIVFKTVKALSKDPQTLIVGEGVLEVLPDGFGFLRSPTYNYIPSVEDIYVSPAQIRRFELRKGDTLVGTIRTPREKEKYFALHKIESVNKVDPIKSKERILFENLTPLYPQERLVMETSKESISTRVLDLAAPIGKGQRAMIVAPPRSGKTILLQEIANAISRNNPEVNLMVLMVGERPEEVTDMCRTINGEVVASTFDEPPERHVQVAEMVIEKARRQVECGRDVVILLDSMTRLARAYNTVQPHSGKILSGGVDANALHKPKRFFGAARNIENGGSLTIIASALIETGSRMDEVIFEEFKGTGNMELVLDRRLADRRTWPAIDLIRSGTRKEDLLYHPSELEKMYLFRQAIADLTPFDAMKLLLERLKKVNRNVEFLLSLKD